MDIDSSLPWNNMHSGGLGHLLARARLAYMNEIEKLLAPHNITSAQFMIVVGIVHQRARTLTEFSAFLGYDTGAMKRLLDRIEDKGIIRRSRSSSDRRTVHVELTAAGTALYPKIIEAIDSVSAKLLSGFSDAEVAQTENLLLRLIVNANSTNANSANANSTQIIDVNNQR